MIIKLIPETDAEKQAMQKIEHFQVKEFFMFGNKFNEEGQLEDFFDWSGQYRYLVGSLGYFSEVINDERRRKDAMQRASAQTMIPQMGPQGQPQVNIGPIPQAQPNPQVVQFPQAPQAPEAPAAPQEVEEAPQAELAPQIAPQAEEPKEGE